MLNVRLITTEYPAPEDGEEDYCPDGECVSDETRTVGFRELVELLREYGEFSSSPLNDARALDWMLSHEQDTYSGGWREHSIHFDFDNPERNKNIGA